MILRRYANPDGSTRFLLVPDPLRRPYPVQAYSVPRYGRYIVELFDTETGTRTEVDNVPTAETGVNQARIALLNRACADKVDLTGEWPEVEVGR